MDQFEFLHSRIDGALVAAPIGEIDLAIAPDLDEALTRCSQTQPTAMIIRLDLVTFLDSCGINVLVKARRQATRQNVSFVLAAPSAPVRKVLDITHLDGFIPTHATLRTALAEARQTLWHAA